MAGIVGGLTGLLAVLLIFGVPGVWILSKTEIGKAITDRIRHGTHGLPDPQLLADVDEMRETLSEVQDRLEFAERQLTALKAGTKSGT